MANLEERSVDREVHLGKVEAELIGKTEALRRPRRSSPRRMKLLRRLRWNSTFKLKTSRKAKAELLDDAADAYAAGFEDALAQVVCKHPEMDTLPFETANHVIDGQIVPWRSQKNTA